MRTTTKLLITGLGLLVTLTACERSPDDTPTPTTTTTTTPEGLTPIGDTYDVAIDPSAFGSTIDNPYFPLLAGSRWVYRGTSGAQKETNVVTVPGTTREVMGVTCIVVRDAVFVDGALEELTFDWYAQDAEGNVWYFGEDSRTIEAGKVVSTEGSWEGGVNGALPGIVMLADPQVGATYRQEYLVGEAEDAGLVISLGTTVETAAGRYTDVLETEDTSLIDPDLRERKFYAPGVGFVQENSLISPPTVSRLVRVSIP